MTADVITLPNVLAQRIRGAYERTERGRQEWIEGTLDLAAALAEARDQFASDKAFSVWLAENELDAIGHQDRAALINMAGHIQIAREVLQETSRFSWRYIWAEEMAPRFTYVGKPAPDQHVLPETAETALPQPENIDVDTPQLSESASTTQIEVIVPAVQAVEVGKTNRLYDTPRAGEVLAVFQDRGARAEIGNFCCGKGKVAKEIWSLILTAIDHGFARPNKDSFKPGWIPARILFTGAPVRGELSKLNITKPKDRARVIETIMPAAIANQSAIIAEPHKVEEIIASHAERLRLEADGARKDKQLADAKAAMKDMETEVVIFGERFWPRLGNIEYGYDQLAAAAFFFDDADRMARLSGDRSPKSRSMKIRHALKWLLQYLNRLPHSTERDAIKRVYQLVELICRSMERDPDGACMLPLRPDIDGDE